MGVPQNRWFMMERTSYQHCQNGQKLDCFELFSTYPRCLRNLGQGPRSKSQTLTSIVIEPLLERRQLIFSMGCQSLKMEAFKKNLKKVSRSQMTNAVKQLLARRATPIFWHVGLQPIKISHVQLMNDLLSVFEVRPISKTYTMLQASCTICVNFSNLNLILCPWCQAMPSCSWNSRSPSQGTWPAASSS